MDKEKIADTSNTVHKTTQCVYGNFLWIIKLFLDKSSFFSHLMFCLFFFLSYFFISSFRKNKIEGFSIQAKKQVLDEKNILLSAFIGKKTIIFFISSFLHVNLPYKSYIWVIYTCGFYGEIKCVTAEKKFSNFICFLKNAWFHRSL